MNARKKITVERLIQWAVNEELCKGSPIGADTWAAIERIGQLGARITGSKGADFDHFGFVDGTPHPDAQAVARCLRDLPQSGGLDPDLDPRELLGTYAVEGFECDPYAVPMLRKARFNLPMLVLHCAIFKTRPVWDLGEPTAQPLVRGSNGKPVVYGVISWEVIEQRRNFKRAKRDKAIGVWAAPVATEDLAPLAADPKRGGYNIKMAPRTPLAWENPAPFAYGEARAEFLMWRNALREIQHDLMQLDLLVDHELTDELPPIMPWNEPVAAPRAMLQSEISPDVRVPLPLVPKRKAPLPPQEWVAPATQEEAEQRKLRAEHLA